MSNLNLRNKEINKALTIKLDVIPDKIPEFQEHIRRAPKRESKLTNADIKLALKNALRYIPEEYHEKLAPEFLDELLTYGRIYGYRFRPEGKIYGKPIDEYKGKCVEGKAFQVMIDNNLDFDVALYPYELVTYGETGQVLYLSCSDGKGLYMPAVSGTAVNTVGAGDSMLAGFLAGYEKTKDSGYALRLGTAAGSATAFSEGLATGAEIRNAELSFAKQ